MTIWIVKTRRYIEGNTYWFWEIEKCFSTLELAQAYGKTISSKEPYKIDPTKVD